MSFETAAQTILDRFDAQFSALEPAVEVAMPNVQFEPNQQEEWVRIELLPGDSFQASVGATRRWRNPGLVAVQIFTKINAGIERALEIADNVTTALRGVTVSGVRLKATSIRQVGAEDNRWFQINANTPYEYDDLA